MSYIQLALEENPIFDGAVAVPTTGPNRISTNVVYLPVTSARIGPGPTHIDRADELRNVEGVVPRILDLFEPDGSIAERAYFNHLSWLLSIVGFTGAITAGAGTAATTGVNATTAVGVNALNSTTINVVSTQGFATAGNLTLAGGTVFAYTGKTDTSFTGCGSHAATTGGESVADVIPVGATKWVFNKRAGTTPKTAQIIAAYTEQAQFLKGNGFGCSQLGLNSAGELSADLMGLVFKRIADPALTPTYDVSSILPARRADMLLQWLTGTGDTDDFSLQITNPLERDKSFGQTTRSYYADKLYQGPERVTVTGSIPKRTLASADIDSLLSAATFFGSARWRSDKVIGATAYPYSMNVDMPACQLIAGNADELTNRRRFGGSFDWFAAYDETAGYDVRITLINSVTVIETYP